MNDEEKAGLADFIIRNDGRHSLLEQVAQILQDVSTLY
jgi:dephospho-CoA kinase